MGAIVQSINTETSAEARVGTWLYVLHPVTSELFWPHKLIFGTHMLLQVASLFWRKRVTGCFVVFHSYVIFYC